MGAINLIKSPSAFERVVKEHQGAVRRLFLNLTLGDSMLSDDLAQDTFVKAYNSWNSFKMLSSTRTWLFRIAYNVFYDYRRSVKLTSDIDTMPARSSRTADTTVKLDIYTALQMLSENERTCVTLAMVEGYSMKEITKITAMAENTVKSHIHRGKEKLSTYLKQQGYE